ncbi:ferredoxin [Desulfomarina profundi]|uniref:Ferredoxin n=1 Tax=Desulfomarina profundi TaxID=2772557 RepID=A0A8D5FHI5_9BACT|nr:mercury methylation ferredoxin HgcB [Desulfomarina profundi]BCL61438.1 ferredoxin [Desulfomarina profundi]
MTQFCYLEDVVTLACNIDKCIGCGMCTLVCPHGVFTIKGKKAVISARNYCMECGACMRNCPVSAISVEAGEGCVRGVINELLGIKGPCC